QGWGVPQDYVETHKWYNLSGAKGLKEGTTLRDDLAKRMTPAQIAEAQKLAQEWKPKGQWTTHAPNATACPSRRPRSQICGRLRPMWKCSNGRASARSRFSTTSSPSLGACFP